MLRKAIVRAHPFLFGDMGLELWHRPLFISMSEAIKRDGRCRRNSEALRVVVTAGPARKGRREGPLSIELKRGRSYSLRCVLRMDEWSGTSGAGHRGKPRKR